MTYNMGVSEVVVVGVGVLAINNRCDDTLCNILQHAATYCNTVQHTGKHYGKHMG